MQKFVILAAVVCVAPMLLLVERAIGGEPAGKDQAAPRVVRLKSAALEGQEAIVVIKNKDGVVVEPRPVVVLKQADGAAVVVKGQGGAGGAVVVGGGQVAQGGNVPDVVDPGNKVVRLLLLLPGGPMVFDVAMTIDAQPYQAPLEAVVDEWLKQVDPEAAGKTTWAEVLANPRFADGRLAYTAQNEQVRNQLIGQYDRNGDTLIDRGEMRRLVAQFTGGASFSVVSYGFAYNLSGQLQEMLDADKNAVISAEELAGAESRLKSRDANDNDVLDQNELMGNVNAYRGGRQPNVTNREQLLYDLKASTEFELLHQLMAGRYGRDATLPVDSFPLVPGLGAQLDANGDHMIDKVELAGLRSIFAHMQLELNLGESGDLPAGLHLVSVSEELRGRLRSPVEVLDGDQFVLDVPGARVQVTAANLKPAYANYDQSVAAMMNQYDADKNGYLEKSELQQGFAQQFDIWDGNGDGKVFADEIKASYEKMQAHTWKRVSAAAADQGNVLLATIDANGDGRIGLREMRIAAARLSTLDADANGDVTPDEVPINVSVSLARGPYGYRGAYNYGGARVIVRGGVGGANQQQKPEGPEWFYRMDTNGDGDVSPREFLGDGELFGKIDANGDGFVTLDEAKAADQGQ